MREAPSAAASPTAHEDKAPENCGCEPFTVVSKDPKKFKICTDRAEKIGKLNTPRRIYDFMAPEIVTLPYEEFYLLGIGAHGAFEGKLMTYAKMGQGSQHKVEVEVERFAQILNADRPDVYIIAHNHPAEDCMPSDGDIQMTKVLREGLKKACPKIVFGDHIILCPTEFYSMKAGKKFKV